MDIVLLIKSGMGLLVILGFLVFVVFFSSKRKIQTKEDAQEVSIEKIDIPKKDLESLRAIVRNRQTSSVDLQKALDMILKYYGHIHEKLGIRSHPDFDIYMEILIIICRHPNTNKDIIIKFDKELTRLNPSYKAEINEALTKGLNSRGV